jgi:hypothetical protein
MTPAILESDRVHELAALHTATGQEVEVTGVIQEIKAPLSHHKTAAP